MAPKRNNRRNSRRRGFFWQGAEIAAHEALWDLVYEDVAKMMEDPETRKELDEAARRLFERIAEGFKEKLKKSMPEAGRLRRTRRVKR